MDFDLQKSLSAFAERGQHFDSLLRTVPPTKRSRIARTMGAFLRRPWTLSEYFQIRLYPNVDKFWRIPRKEIFRESKVEKLVDLIWDHLGEIPEEGSVSDFPTYWVDRWEKDWGRDATENLCRSLTKDPGVTIRVRPGRYDEKTLKKWRDFGLMSGKISPLAFVSRDYIQVKDLPDFKEGNSEIQDEGSQLISYFSLDPIAAKPYLKANPAMALDFPETALPMKSFPSYTLIDACSGSGGKSFAWSDFLGGRGKIFSYDVKPEKIQALKRRASDLQINNVKSALVPQDDPDAFLKPFQGTSDVVLVDAPCSGYGVLRRNPDAKWGMDQEFELTLQELQQKVILRYLPLTKKNGTFVYSVCTFEKSETLDQVEWILKQNPDLRLISAGFIGPYECDSFFMAAFRRG